MLTQKGDLLVTKDTAIPWRWSYQEGLETQDPDTGKWGKGIRLSKIPRAHLEDLDIRKVENAIAQIVDSGRPYGASPLGKVYGLVKDMNDHKKDIQKRVRETIMKIARSYVLNGLEDETQGQEKTSEKLMKDFQMTEDRWKNVCKAIEQPTDKWTNVKSLFETQAMLTARQMIADFYNIETDHCRY